VLCGKAERLMRTIKEEEVDLSEYENYADVVRQVRRFLDEVYLHKRIYSSLSEKRLLRGAYSFSRMLH
jgi:putative transposase